MASSYIFIEKLDLDYVIKYLGHSSEYDSNIRRTAIAQVDDCIIAELVTARLQSELGISEECPDGYIKFETKLDTELSQEDYCHCIDLVEDNNSWAAEYKSRAQVLSQSFHKLLSKNIQHNASIENRPIFSKDFTSLCWNEIKFAFNKKQALCIECLFREWDKGGFHLSEKTIGEMVDSRDDNFKLSKVFRAPNKDAIGYTPHPAWKTIIVSAGKGIFKLSPPLPKSSENPS